MTETPTKANEFGPSAPKRYLRGRVPREIRDVLKEWWHDEDAGPNRIYGKFTLGSVKEVYKRTHGLRDPSRRIAKYTDPEGHILEVKPFLLQEIVPESNDEIRTKRWVLVAQNARNGPWILALKCTTENGTRHKI